MAEMSSLSNPFNQNGKCVVTPRERSHAPKKNLSLWSYQRKYFRNIFVISVFCTSNLDKSRHVQGQGVPIISIIWMSEEKNNDYKSSFARNFDWQVVILAFLIDFPKCI